MQTPSTMPSLTGPSGSLAGRLDAGRPYVLSLFRIVVGLLLACHGFGSLFGQIGPAAGPEASTVDPLTWPYGYAALIELVGGSMVLLGFGTRTAALICSGEMAYAYFDVHAPVGLIPLDNGGEIPAFYSWAFLLLVFAGPGPLSLERVLKALPGKKRPTGETAASTRA